MASPRDAATETVRKAAARRIAADLPGFDIRGPIARNSRSFLFRAHRIGTSAAPSLSSLPDDILVRCPASGVGPAELARCEAHRQMIRTLRMHGISTIAGRDAQATPGMLLLEDAPGDSLAAAIAAGPLSAGEFLTIAIGMTDIVCRLHALAVTHKDIQPENFLWDDATAQLTLTDVGDATRLLRERPALTSPEVIEGSLAYISPEQTGRMNRSLDYRTDLYSLGVTFFEMLTGRLPFESDDPLELVHAHIARRPPRADSIAETAPAALADIVARLLEKDAEDRYQSAEGLAADLERCRAQLAETGRIDTFQLGRNDVSSMLRLPGKLYGRDAEVARLLESFEIAASGEPQVAIVSGYSGIGKTALVREVHRPITVRRGHFVEGKFDPHHRNVPYSAWIAALTGLVHYLLMEGEAELDGWRVRLKAAIGANGAVLTDMIPDLRLVVGEQAPVPELPPTEMQNRFQHVFGDFVRALATREHPLVVFLDDLQWADQASLSLIEALLADTELAHAMLIGAYRENEVDAGHPLSHLLDRVRKLGPRPVELKIKPLHTLDIAHLLADTLHCSVDRAGELARLLHTKSDGNPYFVGELLETLLDNGLLVHDGVWRWDLEAIRKAPIGDDIADLMVGKIAQLPAATLQDLKIAACIGVEFDMDLVARVAGKGLEETRSALQPAMQAGLIEGSNRTGQFVHDRVSEAAYGLLSAAECEALHHAIGTALLVEAAGAWPDDLVFGIAEQLNEAGSQLTGAEKRDALEANLRAGRRARASAAFGTAPRFFERAAALLPSDAWNSDFETTLSLYTDWAETEYAAPNFAKAEELFDLVLAHATRLQDRIRIQTKQIDYYETSMRFADGIDVVREILGEIGIDFLPVTEIGEAATKAELDRFLELMAGRQPSSLVRLPEAPSPYREAIEVLAQANIVLWLAFPGAAMYSSLIGANLILEHGTCGASSEVFALLGALLCATGNAEFGVALGQAALGTQERFGDSRERAMTKLLYHAFIAYWHGPDRDVIEPLRAAYADAAAVGQNLTASFLVNNFLGPYMYNGMNLKTTAQEFATLAGPFFRLNQPNAFVAFNSLRQTVHCLLGDTLDPAKLEGEYWSDARETPDLVRLHFHAAVGVVGLARIVPQVFMGAYREALEALEVPGTLEGIASTAGLYAEFVAQTLSALAYLRGGDEAGVEDRARYLARAEAISARLESAAVTYPPNFVHLSAIVLAEIARVKGESWAAVRQYNRAIAAAVSYEFTHFEALANELAGLFWLDQNRDAYARPHIAAAYSAYMRWGAEAKIAQMLSQHQWLGSAPGSGDSGPLSLRTVMKASQAISSEIQLDRLLARLLQIVIESAGAQRGVLLLRREDGQLTIEAEVTSEERAAILRTELLDARPDLPHSVILYVDRSGESIMLDDAAHEGDFVADPAFQSGKAHSVMCLPIALQGKLLGIIYLDNNLASGAFGESHRELLDILCAQAAISLENARLYTERDRTLEALRQSEEKYRTLVENTADVVFSMDLEGCFSYVSPAIERMSGYRHDEFVGEPFSKFVLLDDQERVLSAFTQAAAGVATPVEFRGLTKEGRTLHLRVAAQTVVEEGRISGFIGILTDVSERHILEEQLLQAMKMDSIGRLAGGVAHDFNNLLTAILGNAELALMDLPPDAEAREAVGEIVKAGQRASSLTRQLLAFASKQIVAPVRLDLSEVIGDSERMLRRLLGEDIEITTVLDPNLSPIEADPGQMEQLLVNLTINARDAMPNGGRLIIETRNAFVQDAEPGTVSEVAAGRYVALTVTDTGSGMAPEVLAHIFEPFYTTKEAGKGTGLGLATCHGIVKQNHGHIFVFSEPTLGSTFRIMLPVARAGATSRPEDAPAPKSIDGNEWILVVEDEASVRRLAVLGLRAHGYAVTEAPDGASALEIVKKAETRIDLVISDVVMPGMSGPDLARELASIRPDLRVILVSGHAERAILPDRMEGGSISFMQKPFTPEQLARRVRDALDAPLREANPT